MKFEKLKPGTTVYSVGKTKMGNTTLSTVSVWPVSIVSVDAEQRTVEAKWNGNSARKFRETSYGKWKEKAPQLVATGLGAQRLATAAERAEKLKESAATAG
jgi:hypothetical protein